jgi:hypothetical protein
MTRIITTTILLLLFSAKVWSQASVTAKAYAEVIAALTATETSQMNFGKFSPEVQGGQIVLSPSGERNSMGSVILGGGNAQPGIFTITGEPEATFSIQLPQGPAYLNHQGSNNTMQVTNWQSDPPSGTGSGTLAEGYQTVSIGATLMVGSLQDNPVGMYTGTFSLTFAYN